MDFLDFPKWLKVADKQECGGSENYKGFVPSVEECALKCNTEASMFIYGTRDYGNVDSCNDNACQCYCETSATVNGTCDQQSHDGYRLYKYVGQGNNFVFNNNNNINNNNINIMLYSVSYL